MVAVEEANLSVFEEEIESDFWSLCEGAVVEGTGEAEPSAEEEVFAEIVLEEVEAACLEEMLAVRGMVLLEGFATSSKVYGERKSISDSLQPRTSHQGVRSTITVTEK